MSMFARRPFACTAIHRAQWSSRAFCERAWKVKASRFPLRRFPDEQRRVFRRGRRSRASRADGFLGRSGMNEQQQSGLVRALGPVDATMIVIGSMIGSGIFITSAESARLSGAPGWLLLAWVIAGLLTMTGALCCSELATMMPRAGGVYVFFREAYGPAMGFLYGWTLFLVVQTGTIAAVAIAFAKFLGVFAPVISTDNYLFTDEPISIGGGYAISLSTQQLVAIGLIALLTWTNTRG